MKQSHYHEAYRGQQLLIVRKTLHCWKLSISFEINVKEKDSENRFGNSIFFSSKILCCMKNETITSSGPLKFCDTHGSLAFSIILANVESNWKGLV